MRFSLARLVWRISIHAPREGCDAMGVDVFDVLDISIHAPREGCNFLGGMDTQHHTISIHAPREGCDVISIDNGD